MGHHKTLYFSNFTKFINSLTWSHDGYYKIIELYDKTN